MENSINLDQRLVIQYEDVKTAVEAILKEVDELRSDSFLRRILSSQDQEQIRLWQDKVQRRIQEPFSLVIMGDFKRGKSTLLNALVGKSVASVNVTPETVTINRISWGEEPRREAVLQNGMRIRLEEEELQRQKLEGILAKLPAPVEYIDIKENCQLLKDIAIIDTPGMGDLMGRYDQQVVDFLSQADAVLYVVSALSPLSESEQMVLAASLAPQSFSRLFVAVNMADCLDTREDVAKIQKLVYDRAKAVMPAASVFAISALDEFCRKSQLPRPNASLEEFLGGSFDAFEDALKDDILLQRDVMKSQRIIFMTMTMLEDLQKRIQLVGSLLQSQQGDLQQMEQGCHENLANINTRLDTCRKELALFFQDLSVEAQVWISDFMEDLKKEVGEAQSQDIIVLQKHLQFYLMDMVKQGMTSCLKAHQDQMEEKLKSMSLDLTQKDLSLDLTQHNTNIAFQISDISWTGADTAAFAVGTGAKMILGQDSQIALLLSGLGQMVGGVVRQSKVKHRQADLIQPLLDQYPGMVQKVMAQTNEAYQKTGQSAAKRLEEIYFAQMKTTADALQHAQQVLERENIQEEELQEHLSVAQEILDHCTQRLSSFGQLW